MTTTLMYNITNQAIQEVQESDVDRMKESGWRQVDRNELLAVYNPALQEHKTVIRQDANTWINLGYYAEPTWVYHPDEGAKMVSAEQARAMREDGWFDSPAKFPTVGTIKPKAKTEKE